MASIYILLKVFLHFSVRYECMYEFERRLDKTIYLSIVCSHTNRTEEFETFTILVNVHLLMNYER